MSYSAELWTSLLYSKKIVIDQYSIIYGDEKIDFSEVIGYNYQKTIDRVNRITIADFRINLIGNENKKLKIHFKSIEKYIVNSDNHFATIISELDKLCGVRLLNEMYCGLISGNEFLFSDRLKAIPQGISYTRKPLFSNDEEIIIRWEEIGFSIREEGELFLEGLGEVPIQLSSQFNETNIPILHLFLNYLHEDSDRIAAIYSANGIPF